MTLPPYSTDISRAIDGLESFHYRHTFSSDIPTSDDDFHPRKRDHSFEDDPRKRHKFEIATYQHDCARRIIEDAIENSKTSIDLSNKNLTTLPDDIRDLKYIVSASQAGSFATHLELFLSRNRLTSLPESLFEIENLAFLGLSGNRLTSLSPSIKKLRNLLSLNIGLNQIEWFPANLLKLNKLEHLIFHSSMHESPKKSGSGLHLDECNTRIIGRPSLSELCMRVIAKDEYYSGIGPYLQQLPSHIVNAILNPLQCDQCDTWMCTVYATREERWSGFARTTGLPIKRYVCSRGCLMGSPV